MACYPAGSIFAFQNSERPARDGYREPDVLYHFSESGVHDPAPGGVL